jgi:hypothetical protein
MSGHATNHRHSRKAMAAVAAGSAGVWLAFMVTAGPANAIEKPEPNGPAETSATVPNPGPPNYPNYDPQYEVSAPVEQGSGLETTSIALGALGGIAFGGAALGITLAVERRRGRFVPRSTEHASPTVRA